MAWYEIINAKSDSFVADRDAEDLLRHLATALQTEDGPVEAEVFYGLTANGARRYYLSLSPEAVDFAERVLATYDARALMALRSDWHGENTPAVINQHGGDERREQRRSPPWIYLSGI